MASGIPTFVCDINDGVFLRDAFLLVSKHYSSTRLLLSPAASSTAQLVPSGVLADHLPYFEKLLKCSSNDASKARGRE